MDDKEREIAIIEHIRSNRGCMPEEVLRAVANHMSRQKFFKILLGLENKNVVKVRYRNKRNQALELNNEDPLSIVAEVLYNFEYWYFDFFDKVLKEIMRPSRTIKIQQKLIEEKENRHVLSAPDHFELFSYSIFVFHTTLNNYLLDILIKWSAHISDKQHLSNIFEFIVRRMSQLYLKLFNNIEKIDVEKDLKIRLNPTQAKNLSELVVSHIKHLGYNDDDPNSMTETFDFFRLKEQAGKIPKSLPSLNKS